MYEILYILFFSVVFTALLMFFWVMLWVSMFAFRTRPWFPTRIVVGSIAILFMMMLLCILVFAVIWARTVSRSFLSSHFTWPALRSMSPKTVFQITVNGTFLPVASWSRHFVFKRFNLTEYRYCKIVFIAHLTKTAYYVPKNGAFLRTKTITTEKWIQSFQSLCLFKHAFPIEEGHKSLTRNTISWR